jgi:enoyl-[acyl-carrier protein] reductase III
MTSSLRLDGKVAIVTGGTRGLGHGIARKLCASGCHVVLNHLRSGPQAAEAVGALSGLTGSAVAVRADVREAAGVQALVDAAIDAHGRLDIFVHNAATLVPMSALNPDVSAVRREQDLAINPLLYGAPLFAKVMAGDGGRVIAISSNGAGHVVPGYLAVGVAKAALESLVRYMAAEFAGKAITVNAIATALLDKGDDSALAPPQVTAMLAARTPGGHLSTPAEVAGAVALLCADEASWIHGQVITVDGGLGLLG